MDKDLLAQEYLQLQKMIEEHDGRALTIKAWSVTFSAAGLATAYIQESPFVLVISALGALAFWLVEALWKTNQHAFYPRTKEIEAALRGEKEVAPMQIATSWTTAFEDARDRWQTFRMLFWPHVAMPHVFIAIVGVALFFLYPPVGEEAEAPTPPPSAAPQ